MYIERERSVTSTSITHEYVARDVIIHSVLRHEPLATLLIALIRKNYKIFSFFKKRKTCDKKRIRRY